MDHRLLDIGAPLPPPADQAGFATLARQAVQSLRQALVDADWEQVRRQAHIASAWGKELLELARREVQRRARVSDSGAALRRIASGRHRGVLESYAASLAADQPDLAARFGPALDALAVGDVDDNDLLAALARSERQAPLVPLLGDTALAAGVRGLQAKVHASFNSATAAALPRPDAFSRRIEAPLRAFVENETARIRDWQRALYRANRTDAEEVTAHLLPKLEECALGFGPVLARAWQSAGVLRDGGKGGAAERVGLWAARGTGTLREVLATYAAVGRIRWVVDEEDSDAARLFETAPKVAFEAELPDGRNRELARLADTEDGAYVEIGGFVEELTVDVEDKLVARATLRDPSSGASAVVVVAYTHLPHRGVVPGAYLRAHGSYRRSSSLNGGSAALEIDRLGLATLAKESWRVGLLRLATPWFERWPNGVHAEWAMGPHRLPGEGGEPDCGACELIFAPLVRGDD